MSRREPETTKEWVEEAIGHKERNVEHTKDKIRQYEELINGFKAELRTYEAELVLLLEDKGKLG